MARGNNAPPRCAQVKLAGTYDTRRAGLHGQYQLARCTWWHTSWSSSW